MCIREFFPARRKYQLLAVGQRVNTCRKLEQQYCIKFCQKLGDTQAETICKIQQAFRDDAMSTSRIKEWYNRFKDGRTSVDSEPRSGRPSTSRNDNVVEQVRTLVLQDPYHSLRNCKWDKGKHRIGTFNFAQGFGHEESVCEIYTEAANNGVEAMASGHHTGHAGQCQQWPQLSEHRDHRWWNMGV